MSGKEISLPCISSVLDFLRRLLTSLSKVATRTPSASAFASRTRSYSIGDNAANFLASSLKTAFGVGAGFCSAFASSSFARASARSHSWSFLLSEFIAHLPNTAHGQLQPLPVLGINRLFFQQIRPGQIYHQGFMIQQRHQIAQGNARARRLDMVV